MRNIIAVFLIAICVSFASAQETQFYLRSPFGSSTCMNGDTGTISWASSRWTVIGTYPTNVANTYCTPTAPTIQFRQWGTNGIAQAKTTGIERALSMPPYGLAYSSVTLVNVSMIRARQAAGCPTSPPTAYPYPSLVFEVSANSVDYMSLPFTQAITTTPRNMVFDVTSVLFNENVVAPTIRIWNGPFAPACMRNGQLVSDVVQIEQVVVNTEVVPFAY